MKRQQTKLLTTLCLATTLFMTGCATGPVVVPAMDVPGIERSSSIAVEDLRPVSETQSEFFSYLITSEAYGIGRLEEGFSNPTGVRLLIHRAYEAFPQLSEAPTIKIHHLVAYTNGQAALRKGALAISLGGVIGGLVHQQNQNAQAKSGEVFTTKIDGTFFQATADKEYQRAFFTEADNPSKAAALRVIYIETEMLGKRIASRSIVPPLTNKPRASQAEIFDICIANHLALYKYN
jgi:hypothetical protein